MKKQILIPVLLILIMFSCKNDNEFDFALIQTGDVTDIDGTGAIFHARISDLSNSNIIQYGFVWSKRPNPELNNSEKYVLPGAPTINIVSAKITTTLQANETYYVRAFIQNRHHITYGKEVVFQSLGSSAPDIVDFYPKTGNLNDTLQIVGSNFSYIPDNNKVYFDVFQANVIRAVQDTLFVVIPENLDKPSSTLSVSIFGNKANSVEQFTLIPPFFYDFEEKRGTYGAQILITGSNFLSNPGSLKVYFNQQKAIIKEVTNTSIKVIVPDDLNVKQCYPEVKMNNLSVFSTNPFVLDAFLLRDFNPKTVQTGERIILTGTNFSPTSHNNVVRLGGVKAKIIKASLSELIIEVPLQNEVIYPERNVSLSVEIAGESLVYDDKLLINDKWFRLSDSPVSVNKSDYSENYMLANCFVNNNKAYIGLNNTREFWEYEPVQDTWMRLSDFPGTPRFYGSGFAINDKVYFGTGSVGREDLADWWEYDIKTNSWLQKSNFSGEGRTGTVAFQIDNMGYLGTGFLWHVDYYHSGFSDFWKYTPSDDKWSLVTDFPLFDYFGMWWGIAIANKTDAFIGLGNIRIAGSYRSWMYRYNASSNTWQRIANYPHANNSNNGAIGFELAEKIYVKTRYSDSFYYYDSISDTWIKVKTDILYNYDEGIAFSVGSKAYVGLGLDNQMWEFDPNR